MITTGLTSKEIARHLGISPLTVRKHRENALRRLTVHTIADLIGLAHAHGLADTPSEVYPISKD